MGRLIDAEKLVIERQSLEDLGQGEIEFYSVEQIADAPTADAIIIPDNATNGDVMVVVYGIVDIEINENSVRLFPKDNGQLWVTREWWDSPYKMKNEDNEK